MEEPVTAFYQGKIKEGVFSGHILEKNFFFVLETEDGLKQEQGKMVLDKIKEEYLNYSVQNLSSLEQFISYAATKYNLPTSFSISTGFSRGDILYLKTVGQGCVYLRRGEGCVRIISGDKSASGYIKENDLYIFTTDNFIEAIKPDTELSKLTAGKSPDESVEELNSLSEKAEYHGLTVLFSEFLPEINNEKAGEVNLNQVIVKSETGKPFEQLKNKSKLFLESLQQLSERSGKKKISTLFAVVIISLTLIWSVVLGAKRSSIAKVNNKINAATESVNLKIKEAEESAFLNLNKSLSLLAEAKKEVNDLKIEVGNDNERVKKLEETVGEAEKKITKKEDKNFEEYFDLTLDSEGAKGDRLYLQGEGLSILDTKKSSIYTLSLTKKSLDINSAGQVKNAFLIAAYQDYKIFNTDNGDVYKLSSENKESKVIAKDSEWGKIADLHLFNGNLYLLDTIKGDVYKYLVTENGYSEKKSYLGGNAGSIRGAVSMAIDSSVYIALTDEIFKFTAGAREDFKTSWPEKNISITKIFTGEDVEKVYVWSKSKGAIYILNKNGGYERQVNSGILSKGSDFAVYKNNAYVLTGSEVYRIDLQ